MVRSVLEYGASIWDPYLKGDIDKLERVQHRAARFITGNYRSREKGCVTAMLHDLELSSLHDRRHNIRLTYLFKIAEGLLPAIPPETYLVPRKQGRKIKPKVFADHDSTNIVSQHACNNNRCFRLLPTSIN